MSPIPDEADEEAGSRRPARHKRIALASALSLSLLAIAKPEAALGCAVVFLIVATVAFWPASGRPKRRRTQVAERREIVWPGRGMKAIVGALNQPAFIIDRDLRLRYRNPASSVVFGNLSLGDPISLLLRSPPLLAAIGEALAGAAPVRAQMEERRPIERHWWVEIDPIAPHTGERPHFFLLLFSDRTGELRSERMRTDFVANASHELRTPLASLIGFIETLQGSARNDPDARERFLEIMRDQAARMSRLIDDLMSLSRIEMKRHVPITERTDLKTVFVKVRSQLSTLADELGMTIEIVAPSEPMIVLGDEDELIQVFANLVENACKYAESGKRIDMRLSRRVQDGRNVIDAAIRDYGEGIPEEHVPRLTERFYRVDTGASRAKRGTGLGLSISRNILLRHKSRLSIESELGKGSTFTARFPALDVPNPDANADGGIARELSTVERLS